MRYVSTSPSLSVFSSKGSKLFQGFVQLAPRFRWLYCVCASAHASERVSAFGPRDLLSLCVNQLPPGLGKLELKIGSTESKTE